MTSPGKMVDQYQAPRHVIIASLRTKLEFQKQKNVDTTNNDYTPAHPAIRPEQQIFKIQLATGRAELRLLSKTKTGLHEEVKELTLTKNSFGAGSIS